MRLPGVCGGLSSLVQSVLPLDQAAPSNLHRVAGTPLSPSFPLRRRRHVDCGIASTSRLPPVPATPRLSATGPIAQLVRAVDSSTQWCAVAEKRQMNGMNSGEPSVRVGGHGNPEPSRRYTVGRCRDYLRAGGAAPAPSALDDRLERPAPNAVARRSRAVAAKGGEIVRARWKHRGHVNPLVPGSSPGGPTKIGHAAAVFAPNAL